MNIRKHFQLFIIAFFMAFFSFLTNAEATDKWVKPDVNCPAGYWKDYNNQSVTDQGLLLLCQKNDCSGYNYTKCPTGYAPVATEMCQSGATKYYKCETCATGYISYEGRCIKKLACKNGSVQNGEQCDCPEGWEGTLCNVASKCPYTQTTCSAGYHETGETCKTGNKTVVKCINNDCSGYNYTKCPTGYAPVATEMCQSGKIKYYKCESCAKGYIPYEGRCIKKIGCKNGGIQEGEQCVCPEGWEGNLCQTASKCPYTKTTCPAGYHETGETCKTGNKTVVNCAINDCSGYEYTKCPTGYAAVKTEMCQSGKTKYYKCESCAKGYISYEGRCIKKLACKNGGIQEGEQCVCPEGWEGNLCQTASKCPYTTKACTKGLVASGNTCKSGKNTYVECVQSVCSSDEIQEGLTCYKKLYCQNGGTQKQNSCQCTEGWEGEFCQTPANCPYTTTSCPADMKETGATCKSGNTIYKQCEFKDPLCATANCGENASCSNGICYCNEGYTGNAKIKCTINTCVHGFINDSGVCICKKGYSGDFCNTIAEGYVEFEEGILICDTGYSKDKHGNCVKKLADKVGAYLRNGMNNSSVSVNNNSDADVYGITTQSNVDITVNNAYADRTDANASVKITNEGNGDVYGVANDHSYGYNAYAYKGTAIGKITINNTGDGNIYGLISDGTPLNNYYNASALKGTAIGYIDITNNGNGNICATGSNVRADEGATSYGNISITNHGNGNIQATESYNISVSRSGTGYGNINITNYGNGNVYGISDILSQASTNGIKYNIYNASNNEDINNDTTARIKIDNYGSGNSFGIFSTNHAYNAYDIGTGYIDVINRADGNAYGMMAPTTHNAFRSESDNNINGYIRILNLGNGNAYGMYSSDDTKSYYTDIDNSSDEGSRSVIEMVNTDSGLAIGMNSLGFNHIINSGDIIIHNLGKGTAIGIYATNPYAYWTSTVSNYGNITITKDSYIYDNGTENKKDDIEYTPTTDVGGLAIGIYIDGQLENITNAGTISIDGAENAYGIYSTSSSSTVNNTGTIILNNNKNATQIKLGGSTLIQEGALIANTLNLDDVNGSVIATSTSNFDIKDDISGDLTMSSEVVSSGFDTTYTVSDMVNASDVSGLNLLSQSALFDAKLENNSDAVLTMKNFRSVVENESLAEFLALNYADQNNEKLFSSLKSMNSLKSLNDGLDDIVGKEFFSRFAFENFTMLRDLNFDMNNKLFSNTEKYTTITGEVSPLFFDGDTGSQSRYFLNAVKDGSTTFGFGAAFSDVISSDDNGDNYRFDRSFIVSMPIGHSYKGFDFITTPRIGYSYGTYEREGLNDEIFEGTVEKQVVSWMNEVRYPIKKGSWNLSPSMEFNMIGYRLKGDEEDKPFSLEIDSQNNYSVEAGIGFYADKQTEIGKYSRLNFNGGIAIYRELANPYEIELGMNNMNGSFVLQDENHDNWRAVVRSGFDYEYKNMSLFGNVATYIDKEYRTDANLDLRFKF